MKTKYQYTKNNQINVSSELGQLYSIIDKSIKQNRHIFRQIYSINPSFSFSLYNPVSHQGVSPQFIKPLLLKQIDQLMQEKDKLLKIRQEANLKKQLTPQDEQPIQTRNTYIALRQAWTKFNNKSIPGCEHVDNLNKIVGMIKKNINSILQSQKGQKIQNQNGKPVIIGTKGLDRDSSVEKIDKGKIQGLKMQNQDLLSHICQLKQKIEQRDSKIKRLESQLSSAGVQIKKSLQMFTSNISRMRSLEQAKMQLQTQISILKDKQLQQRNRTKTYDSFNGEFKVKILSQKLFGNTQTKTKRTLAQLLLFLSPDKLEVSSMNQPTIDLDFTKQQNQSENILPTLDLSTARSSTQIMTDRYTPKHQKFISQRTPRSNLNKSYGAHIQNNEECMSSGKSKKFSRRGEYTPMTTDRYKNAKTIICPDIGFNLQQQIRKKL